MEIKVPEVGESVLEALVARWLKKDGDMVKKDEPLCELETDKITFELNADTDGILQVKVPEGTSVRIGAVIGEVREGPAPQPAEPAESPSAPARVSPSERKSARGKQVQVRAQVREEPPSPGREGSRAEVDAIFQAGQVAGQPAGEGRVTRQPMTPIRRRIAERLLAARQQTAMLTTFSEADMSRVLALRDKHEAEFRQRHGVKLGFMPFFVRASIEALREFPAVNARIDGDDIVYQHFYDIGIAVSGEKGLVVPILRDADRLRFAEIEKGIGEFVEKIRTNKLAIADLEGGTFTITNGGVFGSLLSTPILNPPQSGVLGMHAVQDRPVAVKGKVVIRPMMYLALSYDHRIIDGREAVQFLKKVKECIEEPEELLLES
ncbi:MAG TPA: dihydrolipoyllysine-residue succinyltransferase [Geobacteraceae bacterium]|nr:dihydrolipoyllysine-residue succinyltransferase [Geobacteraceae bacterium]